MAAAQGRSTSSVVVPHDQGNAGAARRAVAEELRARGVAPAALEDTVLVVSELVSNSIRHAQPLPSGEICVRWSLEPDHVHLEIVDGGGATRPQAGAAAPSALGGRGLDIVRSVATQWGVDEQDETVIVWADLPRSTDGDGGAAPAPR
jgi:anti-sigma regulatory factor (Ser/Thr protein kinase)